MAIWTKTETAEYYLWERSDGQAGKKLWKNVSGHAHGHYEEWKPWAETGHSDYTTVHATIDEGIRANGDTLIGA